MAGGGRDFGLRPHIADVGSELVRQGKALQALLQPLAAARVKEPLPAHGVKEETHRHVVVLCDAHDGRVQHRPLGSAEQPLVIHQQILAHALGIQARASQHLVRVLRTKRQPRVCVVFGATFVPPRDKHPNAP